MFCMIQSVDFKQLRYYKTVFAKGFKKAKILQTLPENKTFLSKNNSWFALNWTTKYPESFVKLYLQRLFIFLYCQVQVWLQKTEILPKYVTFK